MDELEKRTQRLVGAGYFPVLNATRDGWLCHLMHSHKPKPHRPPFGRGVTAIQAIEDAERELGELLKVV